jgi:CRP-like cAMP-binding protein
MEYASFLRQHIEEIIMLSDDEFDIVLKHFTPIQVKRKEYLIKEGKNVNSEFFVVKGLLKSFTFDDSGKEYIVQFAMENWWISDYPAYKIRNKGEIYVQALENCIVLELHIEDKSKMCDSVPKMHQFYGSKAFNGFVELQKRVLSLMKNSAKEKYELLLEQYPALFQRVSKTMIAHYLGVSRETLSRLSKNIK